MELLAASNQSISPLRPSGEIIPDSETGTPYSFKHLEKMSRKAGKSLFGKDLLYTEDPLDSVSHDSLSTMMNATDEHPFHGNVMDSISTFEYVFDPDTGKGYDISDTPRAEAHDRYKAKDGNLYSYAGEDDRVHVQHDDRMSKKPIVQHDPDSGCGLVIMRK